MGFLAMFGQKLGLDVILHPLNPGTLTLIAQTSLCAITVHREGCDMKFSALHRFYAIYLVPRFVFSNKVNQRSSHAVLVTLNSRGWLWFVMCLSENSPLTDSLRCLLRYFRMAGEWLWYKQDGKRLATQRKSPQKNTAVSSRTSRLFAWNTTISQIATSTRFSRYRIPPILHACQVSTR
jgi:hypothetical protein